MIRWYSKYNKYRHTLSREKEHFIYVEQLIADIIPINYDFVNEESYRLGRSIDLGRNKLL
jgi:hypothetical protein